MYSSIWQHYSNRWVPMKIKPPFFEFPEGRSFGQHQNRLKLFQDFLTDSIRSTTNLKNALPLIGFSHLSNTSNPRWLIISCLAHLCCIERRIEIVYYGEDKPFKEENELDQGRRKETKRKYVVQHRGEHFGPRHRKKSAVDWDVDNGACSSEEPFLSCYNKRIKICFPPYEYTLYKYLKQKLDGWTITHYSHRKLTNRRKTAGTRDENARVRSEKWGAEKGRRKGRIGWRRITRWWLH